MFEKFLSGNVESFRQRYEGTYGFYRDGRKRLLVRLAEITNYQCSFVDAQNIAYKVYPDHPQEVGFEFLPPKSAWYNTSEGAVFAQRQATRQWQRGVTQKTLDLTLLKNGQPFPKRVDFRSLSEIYEKPILPKDAFVNLGKGMSIAISGQFAFDCGQVYVLKECIGQYQQDGTKFTIKLSEPELWRTEINDALSAMGCSASIS